MLQADRMAENEQTQQSKINKQKKEKQSKLWDHFKLIIEDIVMCIP